MSVLRAVVFDLWETLVDWPREESLAMRERMARRAGIDEERFDALWFEHHLLRETGPIRPALEAMGVPDDAVADLLAWRLEMTRGQLVPREGALDVLAEVRRRGLRVGLLSMCTEEVPELWPDTELAALVDQPVFSCSEGLPKPDPRIYLLACDRLGVAPGEAVFVGDGANDELAGAERAGLRAVLIERPNGFGHGWTGERITELHELLPLLERPAA